MEARREAGYPGAERAVRALHGSEVPASSGSVLTCVSEPAVLGSVFEDVSLCVASKVCVPLIPLKGSESLKKGGPRIPKASPGC